MQTLSQQVTDTLRDWILEGRFQPAERIEEETTARLIGVSRTPVREALANLANEGLIDRQPKRGYMVRVFELEDVLTAYEVRAMLEGLACRRAASRGLSTEQSERLLYCLREGDRILGKGYLDPEDHAPYQRMNVELHQILISASRNSWVSRFADQAGQIPYASGRLVLWDDHALILRSHGDHHRIVEAVIAGDAQRAEHLMREHVYYAGIILKRHRERKAHREATAPPTV
jgi:GntR family transcriptional regulator, vanillate catabolism transcriptional regulator